MRYYRPIWEKIKKEKVVSLTANRKLHRRIFKAVTKEKWMDVGFKLEIEPKIGILSKSSSGSILTLTLTLVRYDGRSMNITEKELEL